MLAATSHHSCNEAPQHITLPATFSTCQWTSLLIAPASNTSQKNASCSYGTTVKLPVTVFAPLNRALAWARRFCCCPCCLLLFFATFEGLCCPTSWDCYETDAVHELLWQCEATSKLNTLRCSFCLEELASFWFLRTISSVTTGWRRRRSPVKLLLYHMFFLWHKSLILGHLLPPRLCPNVQCPMGWNFCLQWKNG